MLLKYGSTEIVNYHIVKLLCNNFDNKYKSVTRHLQRNTIFNFLDAVYYSQGLG